MKDHYSSMAECILLILTLSCMSMQVLSLEPPLIGDQDIVANYSGKSLRFVPNDVPKSTTVLDLSYNIIQDLESANFHHLPHLRVLNISHNKIIGDLDGNLFDSNKRLEYLDVSNNKLKNVSGTFPAQLRFLNVSSNNFTTLSVCRRLGNLKHLKYLGIGARQILRKDLEAISHLRLQNVFLDLSDLRDYQNGSLLLLDTKHLHLSTLSGQKDLICLLFDAVNASTSLELSNFDSWDEKMRIYIPKIADISRVTHLTIHNISLIWYNIIYILQVIWHSKVEVFHLSELTVIGPIFSARFDYSNTSVREMTLHNGQTTFFLFDQSILYRLFSEMNIQNLTVVSSSFLFMTCPLNPSNFQHIDFTNNAMTDDVFQNCENLTKLKTLKLKSNKLQSLSRVSSMTGKMISLRRMDVSHNVLDYNEEECSWSPSVRELDLSSCSLTSAVFQCVPRNTTWLNLANNKISYMTSGISHLKHLQYLNLAYNRIPILPDCTLFPRLMLLSVASNSIPNPSKELDKCQHVGHIDMGNNPFHCFCEIQKFIGEERRSPGKLIGWPEAYTCAYPDYEEGVMLADFHKSIIYCNVPLLVAVIVVPIILGLVLVFGLCKYCDVPWYLKMIWQWTRTKHRTRKSKKGYTELHKDFDFHAFVSYSEHDASWVKNIMLPSIASMDSSLQICQHERNFIAGKPIVDNIISCIERSYKSIFVLSPHFVQSEWCHYELYFAHQQIFTEKTDNLILIQLEPIPQYIIPSRYSRLKALMAKRTYLEWPKEKSKQVMFWANVKAAISINLSDLHYESPQIESQPVSDQWESSQSEDPYVSSENVPRDPEV